MPEYPRLKNVTVLASLRLLLEFETGEFRLLDGSQFIQSGLSLELIDPDIFGTVQVSGGGGLRWINGYALSPELLAQLLK